MSYLKSKMVCMYRNVPIEFTDELIISNSLIVKVFLVLCCFIFANVYK